MHESYQKLLATQPGGSFSKLKEMKLRGPRNERPRESGGSFALQMIQDDISERSF